MGVKRRSRVVPQVQMRRIHEINPADHHRHANVHPTLALEPPTERGPASAADEGTPLGQEGFMNVAAALVAHPQPTELVQPPQGPFHHPAVHSQPAAVFRAPPGQGGRDVAPAQFLELLPGVIGPVGVQSLGPVPLTAHRRHGLHLGQQLGYVVAIGPGQDGRQGCSVSLGEHVMLAPGLAPVRRIGAGVFPGHSRPAPMRCPRKPGTSPSGLRRAIGTTAFHGAFAGLRLVANPATGASKSSQSRSPSPGAGSPRGFRSSIRTECRSEPFGRPGAYVPDCGTAGVWEPARCLQVH